MSKFTRSYIQEVSYQFFQQQKLLLILTQFPGLGYPVQKTTPAYFQTIMLF